MDAKNQIKGMLCATLGACGFATTDALSQYLGGCMAQIVFIRFGVQTIIAAVWWAFFRPQECSNIPWYGESKYRVNIWARGFFYYWFVFLVYTAYRYMPLGDAVSFEYLWPIFAVFPARILLHEQFPRFFVMTFLSCIIGLVFLCQPSFIFANIAGQPYEPVNTTGAIVMVFAIISTINVKLLTRTAREVHFIQIELVSGIQTFVWSPLLYIFCRYVLHDETEMLGGELTLDLKYNLLTIMMGLLGFTCVVLMIVSYQLGEATKIAWFEYFELLASYGYQVFAFGQMPNQWTLIGAVLIVTGAVLPLVEQVCLLQQQDTRGFNSIEMDSELELVEHAKASEEEMELLEDDDPVQVSRNE